MHKYYLNFLFLSTMATQVAIADDNNIDVPEAAVSNENYEMKFLIPYSPYDIKKEPEELYKKIKTTAEACKFFNHKIISYIAQVSFVHECKQYILVENEFLEAQKRAESDILAIDARIFKLIPMSNESYSQKFFKEKNKISSEECEEINNKYVTNNGETFYYIQNCKKRLFLSKEDYKHHSSSNESSLLLTSTFEKLERIPSAKIMPIAKINDDKIMLQMGGELQWSKLKQQQNSGKLEFEEDSLEHLDKIANKQNDIKFNSLCKKYSNKILSYYTNFFYLEKCLLREVLDISFDLQIKVENKGGMKNLSTNEYLSFAKGKDMTVKELESIFGISSKE